MVIFSSIIRRRGGFDPWCWTARWSYRSLLSSTDNYPQFRYLDPAMNAMYDVLFLSVFPFSNLPFSVPCVPWLKTVQLWFGKLLKSNKLKFPKLIHNRKKNPTWQDILYFVDISSSWFAIQIVQSQPKLHYHNFLREVVSGISMWR